MAKKIDFSNTGISTLLNDTSKELFNGKAKITYIDYKKIKANDLNKYEISDIEKLSISIKDVGIRQPIEVKKIDDELFNEMYLIIGGERRYTAFKKLVDSNEINYTEIPCIIIDTNNIDLPLSEELKELYLLTTTNSEQREKSDFDLMIQTENLKKIFNELSKNGYEIKGKQRDIIAEKLDISPSQVQRLDFISKNLDEDFKGKMQKGQLPLTVAVEVAKLPKEEQIDFKEYMKSNEDITKKKVDTYKENQTETTNKCAEFKYETYLKDNKDLFTPINDIMQGINADFSTPITLKKEEYIKLLDKVEKAEKALQDVEKIVNKVTAM